MVDITIPIGFSYEADIYCCDCTWDRFSTTGAAYPWEGVKDYEGNELAPVFPTSEFDSEPHCGSCGIEIYAVNLAALERR